MLHSGKWDGIVVATFGTDPLLYNKINGTNFLAPDAHFDNTCLFSDARGQNICVFHNGNQLVLTSVKFTKG